MKLSKQEKEKLFEKPMVCPRCGFLRGPSDIMIGERLILKIIECSCGCSWKVLYNLDSIVD